MESQKEPPAPLASTFRQEPPTTVGRRTRLLHTCAVSLMAIAHKAFTKVAEQPGPLGTLACRFLSLLANPIAYTIHCHLLAVLSFADDQILACENKIQALFPFSSHLFDMMDWVAHFSETLPSKFDQVTGQLPLKLRRVAILNWAWTHIAAMQEWFSTDVGLAREVGEKEIVMDVNWSQMGSDRIPQEFPLPVENEEEVVEIEEKLHHWEEDVPDKVTSEAPGAIQGRAMVNKEGIRRRGGLKKRQAQIVEVQLPPDATESGRKEKDEMKQEAAAESKHIESIEVFASDYKKEAVEDRILHLFDEGWSM